MNAGILQSVSLGSWENVGSAIENSINSINEMFSGFWGFLTNDYYYTKIMSEPTVVSIMSTVKGVALSLLTLVFFINFLGKTLNLQWVTWENVLMLLLQLVVAKVCVQNAEFLLDKTQSAFTSMVQAVPQFDFIKRGEMTSVTVQGRTGNILWFDIEDTAYFDMDRSYFYFLDRADAARAYGAVYGKITIQPKTFDFSPVFAYMGVFLNSFLMKAILVVALVIMISRYMWLAVYTVASPLALATFAGEATRDIGKSFIKSYLGCCMHVVVLAIICGAFGAVTSSISSVPALGGFIGLIKTFAFGGMIMKSESIANKLCGAM